MKKQKIKKATDSIAKRIRRYHGGAKPGLKTKVFFWMMHLMQKNGWNEADVHYWKEKGWTGNARPRKKKRGEKHNSRNK